jgi:hypothetical protein
MSLGWGGGSERDNESLGEVVLDCACLIIACFMVWSVLYLFGW